MAFRPDLVGQRWQIHTLIFSPDSQHCYWFLMIDNDRENAMLVFSSFQSSCTPNISSSCLWRLYTLSELWNRCQSFILKGSVLHSALVAHFGNLLFKKAHNISGLMFTETIANKIRSLELEYFYSEYSKQSHQICKKLNELVDLSFHCCQLSCGMLVILDFILGMNTPKASKITLPIPESCIQFQFNFATKPKVSIDSSATHQYCWDLSIIKRNQNWSHFIYLSELI